jgi:hypothetical protein
MIGQRALYFIAVALLATKGPIRSPGAVQSDEKRGVHAEEARCLREAYGMQLWRHLGYVHIGEYLEREMGYGPQVGAERLWVARELGALPQMAARLTAGELSYSAVRELTRIATGETEQLWLDEARGKNLPDGA